jgi:FdrA protein
VGELLEAIQEAKKFAENNGKHLDFVASICGTNDDPQDKIMQIKLLKDCGVIVFESNAAAVEYCIGMLNEVNHG